MVNLGVVRLAAFQGAGSEPLFVQALEGEADAGLFGRAPAGVGQDDGKRGADGVPMK